MSSPLTVIYEFDRFRLDRKNQRLTRDGLLVTTPGKTLPILLDLIQRREQVVSIDKLVESHFPKSPFGEEELTTEILSLKRLMGDTSKQAPIIRFVLGQGYQFESEVTEYLGDSSSDQNFGSRRDEEHVPDSTPRKPKSKGIGGTIGIAVAVVAVVAIGVGIWKFMPATAAGSTTFNSYNSNGIPQVAVLPFQSLTGQAGDEGFNRTLTEGIYNAISKHSQIQVVPAEAVQKYLASGVADPVTAGQQLGAQMIVRGMAQRLAGHIIVKVQLVNAQDGSQIWSSGFEGDSNDIPGLAAKISAKIVDTPQP